MPYVIFMSQSVYILYVITMLNGSSAVAVSCLLWSSCLLFRFGVRLQLFAAVKQMPYLLIHEAEEKQQVIIFPPIVCWHDELVVVTHEVVDSLYRRQVRPRLVFLVAPELCLARFQFNSLQTWPNGNNAPGKWSMSARSVQSWKNVYSLFLY